MLQKNNHWCVVCGKGYYACDACDSKRNIAPWRAFTDTAEHFQLFAILRDYNNGVINKAEARELMADMDLSGKEYFREGSRKTIQDILTDDFQKTTKARLIKKRKTSAATHSTECTGE